MLRHEPRAELRRTERISPDPRHRGIRLVDRAYTLVVGGGGDVDLPPGLGEAVEASQGRHPAFIGEAAGRFWWMYEGRIYSAPEWLSRGVVARFAEGREGASKPRRSSAGPASWAGSPPLLALCGDLAPFLA